MKGFRASPKDAPFRTASSRTVDASFGTSLIFEIIFHNSLVYFQLEIFKTSKSSESLSAPESTAALKTLRRSKAFTRRTLLANLCEQKYRN